LFHSIGLAQGIKLVVVIVVFFVVVIVVAVLIDYILLLSLYIFSNKHQSFPEN